MTALAMTTVGEIAMATVDGTAIEIEVAIGIETGIEMGIIAGIMTAIAGSIDIAAKSFIARRGLTCTRITAAIVIALTLTSGAIRTACTPGQTTRAAGKATIRNAHTFTGKAALAFSRFSVSVILTAWHIATVSCVATMKATSAMTFTSRTDAFIDNR